MLGDVFFALIAFAICILVKVLFGCFAGSIATFLAAGGAASVAEVVCIFAFVSTLIADLIAFIIILVRANRAGMFANLCAIFALDVTSGVTSVVINVIGNFALVSAIFNVTGSVASVVINVTRYFANVVTTYRVTNGIAGAGVVMVRNRSYTNFTTYVTSGIAIMAIKVISYCAFFITNIALVVASIGVNMLDSASEAAHFTGSVASILKTGVSSYTLKAANITIGIAGIVPSVSFFGYVTGITAEVTYGVAVTIINVRNFSGNTAKVTCLIAHVIVFMRSRTLKTTFATLAITRSPSMFRSFARKTAFATIGITSTTPIVILFLYFALKSANVTIGIAVRGVRVFANCTFCFTNITFSIASIVILVLNLARKVTVVTLGIALGKYVFCFTIEVTTGVITSCITFIVKIVFGFTCKSTNIAESIAIVIPFVCAYCYLANLSAQVTSGITVTIIVMAYNSALLATNITIGVAGIIIKLVVYSHVTFHHITQNAADRALGRADLFEIVCNCACFITIFTLGIALNEIVGSGTYITAEVTSCITVIIVLVCFALATSVSANVTTGIASVTISLLGVGFVQRLAFVVTTLGITSGITSVIKRFVGIRNVQRITCVSANNRAILALNVTSGIASVVINVLNLASEVATFNITIGIAIVVENVRIDFTSETAIFNITHGIAITGPFVRGFTSVSATCNVTNSIAIAGPLVIGNGSFAFESTTLNVTLVITITAVLVIGNLTHIATTLCVTIRVASVVVCMIFVGSPYGDDLHIIVYGHCFRIPGRTVFEHPTNKIISALGGRFQIGDITATGYIDRIHRASAGRIKRYGFWIKKYPSSRNSKHD